ncbi:MAG: hypothetical protein VKP57_11995 [Candidatus Sericytochromatia bacterium]|nr:hypothetical protein [Candidatus Sericytochromatia bacterium]
MRPLTFALALVAGVTLVAGRALAAVSVPLPTAMRVPHPLARSVTLAPLLDRTGLPEVEVWARQTQDLLAPDTLPLRTIGPAEATAMTRAARLGDWDVRWQLTPVRPDAPAFRALIRELGLATGTDQILVQELISLARVPNPETGRDTDLDVTYRQTLLESRTGALVWQGSSSFALPVSESEAEPAVRRALLETMKASLGDCPWRTVR